MINYLYVIYDKIAWESGPVFEAKNDAVALRMYNNFLADKPNKDDFKLLQLASIDHESNVVNTDGEAEEIVANVTLAEVHMEDEQ